VFELSIQMQLESLDSELNSRRTSAAKLRLFGDFGYMEGWRSKNRVFCFAKLRTVIGPKRCPDLGGSLWYTYFLKILLVCEEMSTGVFGEKRVIFKVCSETGFFIAYSALSTSAGHD